MKTDSLHICSYKCMHRYSKHKATLFNICVYICAKSTLHTILHTSKHDIHPF